MLPGAEPQDYTEQVGDILALLRGTYRSADGIEAHVVPGEQRRRAGVDPGQQRRGERPGGRGQRAAVRGQLPRQPGHRAGGSRGLPGRVPPVRRAGRPYVSVSADVVVAEDEAAARRLAAGYGLWVRSIRTGAGADPVSRPRTQAAAHSWTDEDRALVADRVDTQFAGSPGRSPTSSSGCATPPARTS